MVGECTLQTTLIVCVQSAQPVDIGLKTIGLNKVLDRRSNSISKLQRYAIDKVIHIGYPINLHKMQTRTYSTATDMNMTNICPFQCGNPVEVVDFVDRRQHILRGKGRILRRESTAFVGDPRTGRTSLLKYLSARQNQQELYRAESSKFFFSFLDAQTFGNGLNTVRFWEQALVSIKQNAVEPALTNPVIRAYHSCEDSNFELRHLSNLFQRLHEDRRCLVLLLDEFDLMLNQVNAEHAELFGSLRSLASLQPALVLIVAARSSVTQLNAATHKINPNSSPYFNIFIEFILGDLDDLSIDELLQRGSDRFTELDRRLIRRLAGGNPFLLQASAAAMWELYDEGVQEASKRHFQVVRRLHFEQRQHFLDIWRLWTPEMRQAFTIVGLATSEQLLPGHEIDVDSLLPQLANLAPELSELEAHGLLAYDENASGDWSVTRDLMLGWLHDMLVKHVRTKSELGNWLVNTDQNVLWNKRLRISLGEAIQRLPATPTEFFIESLTVYDQRDQSVNTHNINRGETDSVSAGRDIRDSTIIIGDNNAVQAAIDNHIDTAPRNDPGNIGAPMDNEGKTNE